MRKYSIGIRFLNDFAKENKNGKIPSKNTHRALHNRNTNKTTALLSHRRNAYAFIFRWNRALHNRNANKTTVQYCSVTEETTMLLL